VGRENGEKPRYGIGPMIKRYRQDQQVTQRRLATAAGMSVGALRDLEQGRTRSPRWGTVEELVAALGLDPAQRAELARAWRSGDSARAPRRPGPGLPGLRINVLGPLVAWRDGVQLVLGSVRQRAVLGLMALQASKNVHRDSIIDLLWGERPPSSAVTEVQGYVSRLRKALGDGPAGTEKAELVTTAGGCCYSLNAGPGQLDLSVFVRLIREAREAARSDPGQACERYEHALGLWRGDVVVDVDLLRDHPAAVEVGRRRTDAVLGYAEAAAETGEGGRALPHLRELCAREPLNEQAHACLITVLAATGQQATALQLFDDLRRRLDTELGISPSPMLAQTHAQILRRQLGPSSAQAHPRW
jgi:DNA-binding SARP family transcriptional activator/DNA-binding XRE family transcriptional regulator